MTTEDPLADALLALRLVAADPKGLGGVAVRGEAGPVRDWLLQSFRARLPPHLPARPISSAVDDERLDGGLDVSASLSAGRCIHRSGVIEEAWDGLLIVSGAERLRPGIAARLAHARDHGGPALILLDDGGVEEGAPSCLLDRVAFPVSLDRTARLPDAEAMAATPATKAEAGADQQLALAQVAQSLGVPSARALFFALRAAEAHAGIEGRDEVIDADLIVAARLVLAPRATRIPEQGDAAEPPSDAPESGQSEASVPLEDIVLAAIRPQLLPDLIAALAESKTRARARMAQGRGARARGLSHGRPTGARSGKPGRGVRLALVETLRTAAPWQKARGRDGGRIRLRGDDLRVRRCESRQTVLTVFAVDASGSAAFARLAEAKGAVELLLERAYARRAEVALIAFRGTSAELLLPPTRSLTRARRLLGDLPGGGATPLACGLDAARVMAEAARSKGRTAQLILLTDGRANVARDGTQGREAARADALTAGRLVAAAGIRSVLIDIGSRPQSEAGELATAMRARMVHLPRADCAAIADAAA